ncbi:Arf family guanine nucleotide exchange factor GEA2 [Ascoidea rubescens DSM 1968]|uniref:Sec7-domain-containing protein n=1 Tax=Ascoidea rubescens DSM 1968 TaxID=1344418 RepID=A0A1D2VI52_9ASCO|nr:Sec7-domain-containing protein [Ascoidea rubescens DSM 1968]ODV61289.1 Sec7-domain-containing protein [Ascoidea rubescens DSM 1968]
MFQSSQSPISSEHPKLSVIPDENFLLSSPLENNTIIDPNNIQQNVSNFNHNFQFDYKNNTNNDDNYNVYSNLLSIDPITIVITECMRISSEMRKQSRFSQTSVAAILGTSSITTDNSINFSNNNNINTNINTNSNTATNFQTNNPLLSGFLQLRSMLLNISSINQVDPLTLLQPFLLLIKSPTTSAHITLLALNSLSKFINYNIISINNILINNDINIISEILSSLTHCKFEANDQTFDDTVLLKVLNLLQIILSQIFNINHFNLNFQKFSNGLILEIIQTCLNLACNKRRNEILRKNSEQLIFDLNFKLLQFLKFKTIDSLNFFQLNSNSNSYPNSNSNSNDLSLLTKNLNNLYIDDINSNVLNNDELYDTPLNYLCVKDYLSILISILSPQNRYYHTESTKILAINIINFSLETFGNFFIFYKNTLFQLLRNPLSKNLLMIILNPESTLPILSSALNCFINLIIILGDHLNSQIEFALENILKSIVPENLESSRSNTPSQIANIKFNKAAFNSRLPISKELIIESISLLWIRSHFFFLNLFIKYDCKKISSVNLSYNLLMFLNSLSFSNSSIFTTNSVPPICLDGLCKYIEGIGIRIKYLKSNNIKFQDFSNGNFKVDKNSPSYKTSNNLLHTKSLKDEFLNCIKIFNTKGIKKGLPLLEEKRIFFHPNDSTEVRNKKIARFFYLNSNYIDKKSIGDYISKRQNTGILREFLFMFDFTGLRVDEGLRIILRKFRLPGESQQIEKIVEQFAEKYVQDQNHQQINEKSSDEKNQETKPVSDEIVTPNSDTVFVLSYAIILLNTDLHSPKVKEHMTLLQFKRNLRGTYNGGDFPEWYLEAIYNDIQSEEIILPEEHVGSSKWFDASWAELMNSAKYDEDEFYLNEYLIEEDDNNNFPLLIQFDKLLFESVCENLINTFVTIFKEAHDDQVINKMMAMIDKCATIANYFGLYHVVDNILLALGDLTLLIDINDDDLDQSSPSNEKNKRKKIDVITVSDIAVSFGKNYKAQLSTVVLFRILKSCNYNSLVHSWKCFLKILLKLFQYSLINPNKIFPRFQRSLGLNQLPSAKPQYLIKKSLNKLEPDLGKDISLFGTISSILRGYSDEPPEPTNEEIDLTLSTMDCINSSNINLIISNILKLDKENLNQFIKTFFVLIPNFSKKNERYYESEVLFIIELSVCFCLLQEKINKDVLLLIVEKIDEIFKTNENNEKTILSQSSLLRLLTYQCILYNNSNGFTTEFIPYLKSSLEKLSDVDSEILKSEGYQILKPLKSLIFTLSKSNLSQVKSEEQELFLGALINNENYWRVLRTFASSIKYVKNIYKFTEELFKNYNDCILPDNFIFLLGLLDEISSKGSLGAKYEQDYEVAVLNNPKNVPENKNPYEEVINISIQSIELTVSLSTYIKRDVFVKFQEDTRFCLWYSIIQAVSHQAENPCRKIRNFGINTLSNILLSLDIRDKKFITSLGIFNFILFKWCNDLIKPEISLMDLTGFNKSKLDLISLICKVFLKHFNEGVIDDTTPLNKKEESGESQTELRCIWFGILDIFEKLHSNKHNINRKPKNRIIREASVELLRNLLLVMDIKDNDYSWKKIDSMFSGLKEDFYR